METSLSQVKERATMYGINSLTDKELLKLCKLPTDKTINQLINEGNHQIKAMLNLAFRHNQRQNTVKKITKSSEVYDYMSFLKYEHKEEFWAIYLNNNGVFKSMKRFSIGTYTGTVFPESEIVKEAILIGAKAVILCHNHPSGSLLPSEPDKEITSRIKIGLNLFSIQLFEHMIVGGVVDGTDSGYYSFSDNGLI
jgi:DNA repair protein RadC